MKEIVEKDMLDGELKKTDAQDHTFWRFGCKNCLTPACEENKLISGRIKDLSALQKQMGDDDVDM